VHHDQFSQAFATKRGQRGVSVSQRRPPGGGWCGAPSVPEVFVYPLTPRGSQPAGELQLEAPGADLEFATLDVHGEGFDIATQEGGTVQREGLLPRP
jgi:hypothetical protein